MTMRDGFVQDNVEKIMQFVVGLRLSIKRKISVDNIHSLEDSYHIFLKIEEGKLKRKRNKIQ